MKFRWLFIVLEETSRHIAAILKLNYTCCIDILSSINFKRASPNSFKLLVLKLECFWRNKSILWPIVPWLLSKPGPHYAWYYNGVIMASMTSQITSLPIVYSTVYSGADQRKHQTPRHLPFCREFTGHRWIPPHKWAAPRKMFLFDDVITENESLHSARADFNHLYQLSWPSQREKWNIRLERLQQTRMQ